MRKFLKLTILINAPAGKDDQPIAYGTDLDSPQKLLLTTDSKAKSYKGTCTDAEENQSKICIVLRFKDLS